MEKKYLEATAIIPGMGRQKIVFDDVKDFEEVKQGNAVTSFKFSDKDDNYNYILNASIGKYEEAEGKAPDLVEYSHICRRTAKGRNLVGDNRTEVTPDQWQGKTSTAAAMHDLMSHDTQANGTMYGYDEAVAYLIDHGIDCDAAASEEGEYTSDLLDSMIDEENDEYDTYYKKSTLDSIIKKVREYRNELQARREEDEEDTYPRYLRW